MQHILLLDDSLIIHKVVKITYSADKNYNVRIAMTQKEADEMLESFTPELIIGYARFCGPRTLEYFAKLKEHCGKFLLLAESGDSMSSFEQAGFSNIIRKPFHSDQLKTEIANIMGNTDMPTRTAV